MAGAMQCLGSRHFDAAFVSLHLSDWPGLAAIRALRNEATHLPIVVLLSPQERSLGPAILREGGQGYVLKQGLSMRLLLQALHYAIDWQQVYGQLQRGQGRLLQRETLLRSVVDANPNLMCVKDEQGRFVVVNEAWAQFYGRQPEDLIGRTGEQVEHHPSQTQRDAIEEQKVLESFQEKYIPQEARRRSTGEVHWFQTLRKPLLAPDGRQRYVLCVATDITARLDAEEQLWELACREPVVRQVTQRIRKSLVVREVLRTAVEEIRPFANADRVEIYCQLPQVAMGMLGVACDRYQPPTAVVEQPLKAVPYVPVVLGWLEERDWRGGEISAAELVRRCPAVEGPLGAIAARSLLALPIFRGELPLSMPDAAMPITGGQGVGIGGGLGGGFKGGGVSGRSPEEEQGPWGSHRLWGVLLACDQQETRAWPDWQVRFLEQLAEQVAIAVQQAGLVQRLAHTNHQLEKMANQDGLTGIANRRYFDTSLHREWHRRPSRPLGILLGDVDAFKGYNDRYGHLAGDDCLRQVATAIARTLRRATDDVFRYGGEEFIILLPDTDLAGVIQVGRMVLEAVRSLQIDHIDSPAIPYVTLSLGGISAPPNPEQSPTDLVDWADRALFQAKEHGRNQLWVAERLGGPLAAVDGRSLGVSGGLRDPLKQFP
ncbi:MAG: hypothetical protein Fur0042_14460 [Cyanophyceae cyanobacterium]